MAYSHGWPAPRSDLLKERLQAVLNHARALAIGWREIQAAGFILAECIAQSLRKLCPDAVLPNRPNSSR